MELEHVDQFVTFAFAGLGMLLAGGFNLLVSVRSNWVRAAGTALVAGLAVVGAALWTDDATVTIRVLAILTAVLVPLLLAGKGFRMLGRWLGAVLGRPAVAWGVLAAVGLALIAGSAVVYEIEDEAWAAQESRDALATALFSNHVEARDVRAVTDRGNKIILTHCPLPRADHDIDRQALQVLEDSGHIRHVIIRRAAGERSNCHGWVFTDGQYGVNPEMVDTILADNGYEPTTTPQPGDLAIYRQPDGLPSHTAIVRYVSEGMPVVVEGKWGWMGVYLHPVDQSIYGTEYRFYRTHRSSHVLKILPVDPSTLSRP